MGAAQSRVPGRAQVQESAFLRGPPSRAAQRTCQGMPLDRDPRYVLLRDVYGVPSDAALSGYLRSYTKEMAAQDLAACRAGRALPHAREVTLFHALGGPADVRHKALRVVHGFSAEDVREHGAGLAHYTPTMAREDLSRYAREGRARHLVHKSTSHVLNTVGGHVYGPQHRGYHDEVAYSRGMSTTPAPSRTPVRRDGQPGASVSSLGFLSPAPAFYPGVKSPAAYSSAYRKASGSPSPASGSPASKSYSPASGSSASKSYSPASGSRRGSASRRGSGSRRGSSRGGRRRRR